jgi:hypothetical protein
MRLGTSLTALVALASTSVVRSSGLFDTGSISSFDKHVESQLDLAARATVTTGCTCYSFLYRNSAMYNNQYIVGTYNALQTLTHVATAVRI